MGFTLRMAAVSGAAAAGIALIAGLFARVPFGYILLRSFIGGTLFAGFGFGTALLLERFLPELFEEAAGSGLDISVGEDDEDDLRRSAYAQADDSPAGVAQKPGERRATNSESDSGFDESADAGEGFKPGIDAQLVEEVREQHSDESADDGAASDQAADWNEGEVAAEDIESIDALPDMEGMADAFISAEEPAEGIEQSVDGPDNPEQAKEIAQAIRTVLQREQQG